MLYLSMDHFTHATQTLNHFKKWFKMQMSCKRSLRRFILMDSYTTDKIYWSPKLNVEPLLEPKKRKRGRPAKVVPNKKSQKHLPYRKAENPEMK